MRKVKWQNRRHFWPPSSRLRVALRGRRRVIAFFDDHRARESAYSAVENTHIFVSLYGGSFSYKGR